jgi:hypothetical protein
MGEAEACLSMNVLMSVVVMNAENDVPRVSSLYHHLHHHCHHLHPARPTHASFRRPAPRAIGNCLEKDDEASGQYRRLNRNL